MSMSLMRNCGFDVEIGDSWRRRAIVTSSAMVALLLLLTIAIPTGVVDGPYITSNSKLHSLLHRKLLRPATATAIIEWSSGQKQNRKPERKWVGGLGKKGGRPGLARELG
ncbi:hypothetical protein CRG98_042529 [Punica granatum]|uniref:Uncharacterized protein n=1 Tax=Punica granatum TaxID=22663 RepID=A0A2I0HZG0_PUNGR|nr:hypothetical protein CRG98_042529 [Punica granatum]